MKRQNVARVFETIRTNGAVTRQLIGEISGLSKPTVNEALDVLLKKRLILQSDAKTSAPSPRPGPKAQEISINKDRKRIIAIDIGSSKIRILVSDLNGNVITAETDATPHKGGRQAILLKIAELVERTLIEHKLKMSDIGSVVAGSPGTFDPATGNISRSYNLPEWENFSLSDELSKILKTTVHAENEAHLAIYGEYWRGSAKNLSNVAVMSVGVGIGLGLLIHGQVYRGFNGIAGEVGNLPLQISDSKISPLNANFEFHASASGIERKFESIKTKPGAADIIALAGGQPVTAKVIYAAAAQGNKLAANLVAEQLELLSRGIAAVCCITNPEVFILEGGLAPALEPHLEKISKLVQNITLIAPKIVVSELEDLATVYGAIRRGIDSVNRATLASILQIKL